MTRCKISPSCKEIVKQKPSFFGKTRFLFVLYTFFLPKSSQDFGPISDKTGLVYPSLSSQRDAPPFNPISSRLSAVKRRIPS